MRTTFRRTNLIMLTIFYYHISFGNSSTIISEIKSDKLEMHVFREFAVGLSSRTDLVKKERVSHDHIHEVIFAIKQMNVNNLIEILHDVSDPDSPNYGKHRSRDEIEAIASNPASRNYLLQFLQNFGATIVSESLFGEYVTAKAPVSLWEKFFKTEFYIFHQTSEGSENVVEIVRALMYSVPATLHEHIASVFQTVQMTQKLWGRPIMHRLRDSVGGVHINGVKNSISPKKLNRYYSIKNNIGTSMSSQLTFQSTGHQTSAQDLRSFQDAFNLPRQNVSTFVGNRGDDHGCTSAPGMCAEGNLSIQYIMAICQGSATTNWYTDMTNISDWLLAIANIENPPMVISLTYGITENRVSASEFDAFNLQALKLGLLGVTILVSSGGSYDLDELFEFVYPERSVLNFSN